VDPDDFEVMITWLEHFDRERQSLMDSTDRDPIFANPWGQVVWESSLWPEVMDKKRTRLKYDVARWAEESYL